MASAAGALRLEALITARVAYFACFPGTTPADRIITVRAAEYEHGLALLQLCRSMRPVDRATLQGARCRIILRVEQDLAASAVVPWEARRLRGSSYTPS